MNSAPSENTKGVTPRHDLENEGALSTTSIIINFRRNRQNNFGTITITVQDVNTSLPYYEVIEEKSTYHKYRMIVHRMMSCSALAHIEEENNDN